MRQVYVLVLGNIREAVRDKLLLSLLCGGILILVTISLMSPLNLGARDKTFNDMGLAWVHLSGLLILLVLGAWTIHRERERGIWLTVLTRPISRSQFLLGRLAGMLATLAITVGVGTTIHMLIAQAMGIGVLEGLWLGALYIFLEMSLLAGLILFFSTISGFAMTVFMALAIFFAGHMSSDLLRAAVLAQNKAVSGVMLGLNWLLPHMELFRVRGDLVGGEAPTLSHTAHAFGYACLYIGALFFLSLAVFSKKDIR